MANGHQECIPVIDMDEDFYEQKTPERLQDDPLVSYFRCRYRKRTALLAGFEERFKEKKYKFERIKQELGRIDQLRSGFHSSHKFHMDRLRSSREGWMQQAKNQCQHKAADVAKEIACLEAKKDDISQDLLARKRYELKVLRRVPDMDKEDSSEADSRHQSTGSSSSFKWRESTPAPTTTNPGIKSTETASSLMDPDHGFMVNLITLKRKTPESSYDRFEMEKSPVNEALDGTRDMQLKQRCKHCEPHTLRYFHFPANNMSWIEVSPMCIVHNVCIDIDFYFWHRGLLLATMVKK
jgi:hypothetical protein